MPQVYRGDCWQHLRNIMIDAMAAKGDEIIKERLTDDLSEFHARERIDVRSVSSLYLVDVRRVGTR